MSELLTLFERDLRRFQPYFQHNEIHPKIHIEAIQRGAKVVGLKISQVDSEGRVLRCYRFAASKTRKASSIVKALNDRLMHVELREFLKTFRGKARAGMQMGGYGSTGFSVDICPKKAPWPLEQARIGMRMLPGLGAEPKGVVIFGIPTSVDAAAKAIRIMKQEHIDLCCSNALYHYGRTPNRTGYYYGVPTCPIRGERAGQCSSKEQGESVTPEDLVRKLERLLQADGAGPPPSVRIAACIDRSCVPKLYIVHWYPSRGWQGREFSYRRVSQACKYVERLVRLLQRTSYDHRLLSGPYGELLRSLRRVRPGLPEEESPEKVSAKQARLDAMWCQMKAEERERIRGFMVHILDLFPVPVEAEPSGFPFGMSFFLKVRSKPGAAILRIYCSMKNDPSTDSFYASDHVCFSSVNLRRESLLEVLHLIADGNRVLETGGTR